MTASHWRQKQTTKFFVFLAPFVYLPSLAGTCVLLVATPTSTISVYYFSMCSFVATPMSTVSVYYFNMCTVSGHSHIYY